MQLVNVRYALALEKYIDDFFFYLIFDPMLFECKITVWVALF